MSISKEYDKAVADLNAWIGSFYLVGQNGIESLTRERIAEVYGDPSSDRYIAEYTALEPTSRKPLHPHGFTVEAGEQEHLIQTTLFLPPLRPSPTDCVGGDIKRYGIVIDRFDDSAYNDDNTTGFTVAATLGEKDLRRALQLPQEVITAGLEANPAMRIVLTIRSANNQFTKYLLNYETDNHPCSCFLLVSWRYDLMRQGTNRTAKACRSRRGKTEFDFAAGTLQHSFRIPHA